MSLRFRIVLSCACALLFAMACYAYGERVREDARQAGADALARYGGEVARLVVADEALEPGDVVSEMNASERDWASTLAPDGALTSFDDAAGRQVTAPVAKGMPLCEVMFREDGGAVEVPSGHVALTLPVSDKLGIANGVSAGTRVEAYQVDDAGSAPIASDMQVLSSTASQGGIGQPQVTLAVLPDDVAAILSASSTGDLRLVLPAEGVTTGGGASDAPQEVAMSPSDDAAAQADAGGASGEGSSS